MGVEDEFGEFHQLKRKNSGTWVNWGLFYQVWVKIREVGKWKAADYTVKIDADAVFVPQRLRTWLSSKPGDSPHGLYYENCPNVQYGFFGHLEIITKTGVQVLTKYLEECHTAFAPCANEGCDWKFGVGRRCLRPEMHGSPLCRQGRGLRCGHGWRVCSGQARGGKEEQKMASHRLPDSDDSDGAPPEEARRIQKMLEGDDVLGAFF